LQSHLGRLAVLAPACRGLQRAPAVRAWAHACRLALLPRGSGVVLNTRTATKAKSSGRLWTLRGAGAVGWRGQRRTGATALRAVSRSVSAAMAIIRQSVSSMSRLFTSRSVSNCAAASLNRPVQERGREKVERAAVRTGGPHSAARARCAHRQGRAPCRAARGTAPSWGPARAPGIGGEYVYGQSALSQEKERGHRPKRLARSRTWSKAAIASPMRPCNNNARGSENTGDR